MNATQASSDDAGGAATVASVATNLEVIVISVSDVDRAKEFYGRLGWRLDADVTTAEELRLIQFTPPGSGCSIQFGTNLTSAPPGAARGSYLVVADIEAVRDGLLAQGVEVSEVFHEGALGGRFQPAGADDRLSGPAPDRMARSPRSAIRTATAGCSRKSPRGCPGGSTLRRLRSLRPAIWRRRCGARRPRMGSTRSESVPRIPTGRSGTPSTWSASRRERSSRHDHPLRRHRPGRRRSG